MRLGLKVYIHRYIYIFWDVPLASKTIMISEEAYEILRRRKRPNESFTDVIVRLGHEKGSAKSLLELARNKAFEPVSPETAKIMKETSRAFRKNFKTRDFEL